MSFPFAAIFIGVILALVLAFIQLQMSLHNWGILSVFGVEVALSLAAIWGIGRLAESAVSDTATSAPVGFVVMIFAGMIVWALAIAVLLNAISGLLIWRLTRAER
jgi:hypothetical protein